MILEGIVTSLDAEGSLNVAPMGPIVDLDATQLVLRPFQTSQTYRNLKQRPAGVFHVVDDVLLLARAAIGRLDVAPGTFAAERVDGRVLSSACRWYEFEIESIDDSRERTEIVARVVHMGRLRDVFGFNRAKHAVIEAAILATRLHLLPRDEIARQFAALKTIVEKTAGPQEREAFQLLERHVSGFPPTEGDAVASESTGIPSSSGLSDHVGTHVRVRTGSRLHFGPLAVGASTGRQFGGVGMMLESPGFTVAAQPLDDDSDDGIQAPQVFVEAIRTAVARFRESIPSQRIPRGLRIVAESVIPAHSGLGSGTQLALAVARAVAMLDGETSSLDAVALAERVGRGARSAIGIHGFERGGLLLDGGKKSPGEIGVLVTRAAVPDWRIVLITPPGEPGLSGLEERQAFVRLSPMSAAVTERLCRLAVLDLVPAVQDADFEATCRALHEYGRTVGEYFAPAQGGVYAHPAMRELVPRLRSKGFEGVGQTSWGPSLFVFARDDDAVERVRTIVEREPVAHGCRIEATRPLNRGASVVLGVGSSNE